MADMMSKALALAAQGMRVLPLYPIGQGGGGACAQPSCQNAGKHPQLGAWQKRATTDAQQIRHWWTRGAGCGIGIATGVDSGIWVLDIDTKDGARGMESLRELEAEHGALPETLTALTGSGGEHYYFKIPAGTTIRNRAGVRSGIDVRGDGGYVVAPPSPHACGKAYEWEALETDTGPVDAPQWLIAMVTATPKATTSAKADEDISENRNDTLMRIGCALRGMGLVHGEIAAMLATINANRCKPALPADEVAKIATSCAGYPAGKAEGAASKARALDAMSPWAKARPPLERANEVTLGRELLDELAQVSGAQPVHDEGRLWVYLPSSGIWEEWTEQKLCKMVQGYEGRSVYDGKDDNGKPKHKRLSLSASRVAGSVKSAVRDSYAPGAFGEPRAGICCANGFLTVTAAGAELVEHSPEHRARAQVSWAWEPTARADRWTQFLLEVFEGADCEPKAMLLQEFAGAALVAGLACQLQRCLVLYGGGANGKSCAMSVISQLVPAQARAAVPPHSFGQDYAASALRGIQLNAAGEIPDASIGSSDRFKSIIAGEAIQAREPFKPSYTFKPAAAHVFSCNTLPGSTDTSKGFFRRFMVLEWLNLFEGARAAKGLAEHIVTTELPGVARWAVDGAIRLMERGEYTIPATSSAALNQWKHSADQVAQYVAERCKPARVAAAGSALGTKAAALYSDYRINFCDEHGYRQLSRMRFCQRLQALGFRPTKAREGMYYPLETRSLGSTQLHDWGDDITAAAGRVIP